MLNRNLTLFIEVETKQAKEIVLSEAASAVASTELLDKIKDHIRETNNTIKISSALPGHENKAIAVDTSRKIIDQGVFDRLKNSNNITETLLLRLLNLGIKAQQAGNCYEFSLFCHALLKKDGINSEIFRINGGNHVFLVINRDQSISAHDFQNWNKEAIVVDPFFSSIYASYEIPNLLQSCLYDEDSNKVSYIPFDQKSHTLSNDVLKNLVEDWEASMRATPTFKRI